ncbi:MAG: lysophospholipid acyltransferase family protein [Myxococcota bacterium]
MRVVIAALRTAGFLALTGLVGAALLATRGRGRARGLLLRFWSRSLLRLLAISLEVRGTPPPRGVALVTNHLSYLDIPVLGALVDAVFVAKADVAGWPGIGALAQRIGTIFIDRARKRDLVRVLPLVEAELRARQTVVFFPEATSSAGAEILRFRSSLFAAPVRASRPVACAAIHYETDARDPHASLAVCWWGEMPFVSHLFALMKLRGVRATVSFPAETLWEDDRKRLSDRAHDAIRKHWQPVLGGANR